MMSVYLYSDYHDAECRYAECHYAKCRCAECRYADCHYAECRGATAPAKVAQGYRVELSSEKNGATPFCQLALLSNTILSSL
jgi:hypothetical protein